MSKTRFSSRLLVVILLVVLFCVALYLRVVLPYNQIFVGDSIRFNSNDAYYYLRQIDSLVHNFPYLISFDPYLNYPTGLPLGSMNFFVYLLGGIIWLISLGSPSSPVVDTISAFFPAVLGALTVIPVYFIGKALFDRRAGIVAAALITILPGEFMGRTILGYTDRDALEILLTTLMMLFLILAIRDAREKRLTFRSLNLRHLSVLTRPVIYSLLSGILLGLCLLTWRGSFLFVLIILAYVVVQSILDHLKYESSDPMSFVGIITFLMALLVFGVASRNQLYSVALALSLLLLVILSGLAWLLRHRKIKTYYYPLIVIGIGLFGLGILYAISPVLLKSILDQFSVFAPTQSELTISEMKPILFPAGNFTLALIWSNYTTGLFLSLISLGVLIYLSFKRGETGHVLIIIWSLITLSGTLALRRIAPFFAINVALLTGYLSIILYYIVRFIVNYLAGRRNDYVSSRLLESTGFRVSATATPSVVSPQFDYYEALDVPRNATRKQIKRAYRGPVSNHQTSGVHTDEDRERLRQIDKAYAFLSDPHKRAAYDRSEYGAAAQKKDNTGLSKRGGFQIARRINMAVAGLVIFFLVFFPNFKPAATTVSQTTQFAPSDAWYNSLSWLRDNTPEPFGDAASYYDLYHTPFYYPETTYSVAAWWDYGYQILGIGHRLPSSNPGGGDREIVARLFTAQNEVAANELAGKLNSKYIILDDATVTTKFHAVETYAGTSRGQFFDIYYKPVADKLEPALYYYPEYYQSLAVRLYYFNGKKVTPYVTADVISYVEKESPEGVRYKEILSTRSFPSSEEAAAYISKQASGNYKIVSFNPSMSPVPLEALEHYKLVYPSAEQQPISPVKIFEYIKLPDAFPTR